MLQRSILISFFLAMGLGTMVQPALGQAVVPRTLKLDSKQLEQTGLGLFKEAVYLSQFQQIVPALARAKLATQLAPKSPDTWALLGGLYLTQKQVNEGIQALEKSRSLNPKNAGVHFSLGAAYFGQGKYDQAVQLLTLGLKLKPDVPEALFDLGNTYYKMGKLKEAVKQYKKSLDLNKKFWPALNNIGLVHYEKGDASEAMKQWQAAIAIDAKSGEPQLALAVATYTQGKKEEGLTLAKSALKLDGRYGKVAFLEENLWGKRLIADTKIIFATPEMQSTLSELDVESDSPAPTNPEGGVEGS
ncbi:MAG: tetratricopeptide repeat protein [Leptolyngbyaceae cyanobacterium CRU_2_3]|nr:tetratricopeptide repeat protein [Acaryochloris sp. RU_4_1]NJN38223.1 tetratricopeptide repeat protein [Acaryochloridaceae cyanobacterium CSU_3_4]NJR64070.1 tetratricopeptide repeat protein [Leptolyngbyaceae cyanobacterium CRU_2_3]